MNLKKTKIAYRIMQLRKEMSLNQTKFGDLFGRTKASVSQWESERTIPERDSLLLLQKKTGINPDWILCTSESKFPQNIKENSEKYTVLEEINDPRKSPRKIPVVGTAQLGPDGYWHDLEYPVGHGDGYVDFFSTDDDSYALRVKGDSMTPAIRNGWLVIVEPGAPYKIEDLVVVCTNDGQCMVKEFYTKKDNEYIFLSINPSYDKLTINENDIEKIHVVSAIIPPSRYNPD